MRNLFVFFTLIVAISLIPVAPANAEVVYRPGEGFHSADEDSGPVEKTASEQLKKAKELEANGDFKKALGAYRALLTGFPKSGVAPQAQFKIAEMYEKTDDPELAFKAYGKYVTNYPRGEEFDTVVERQFNIGKAFLNGERRKLWGVKTFSSMERTQKMFEEIVKNAPYSKYAPLAQFNIGMALEKQGMYPEAIAAYQLAVDKYPNDDVAADAQYQIGYVQMHLIEKGSNDDSARIKAKDAFEDFTVRYPKSEKLQQAQENITKLTGNNLKKNLDVGKFYEKTKNFKAAVIYYKDVVENGKGTPEAEQASKGIERLKASVGEDALRSGPENAETGSKAQIHKKMQAQVETASRPDYAGPPAPAIPDETTPEQPKRSNSGGSPSAGRVPEPPLPSQ